MGRTHRARVALGAGLLVALLPLLALAASPAEPRGANKIDPELADQLAVAGRANFWIAMAEQADLSAAYEMDWQARGWYAYETLAQTARTAQAGVIAYLEAQGLAYDSFWIDNSIYVRSGSLETAQDLAARGEIARLKADGVYYLPTHPANDETQAPAATQSWGLGWVHAPQVWALGYDGAGIVVASIDTGVQYTHPQLDETYRGAIDGTHQYNWCDPSDICPGDAPCDNEGHGTHVMGTLSGENDSPALNPYVIGMAPASAWITCKGCEGTTCSEFALTECAQWIAAPSQGTSGKCGTTGTPNPDKRPHIVNNSWGDTASNSWFRPIVQNWQALGILATFSAGNTYTCASLGSPGDYPESFASANIQSSGAIHPFFSSRGPSTYGTEPYCKPNIAAPGTNILSSVPTNLYEYSTGTSMASPHSAGAAALVWQACPELVGQVDLTFQVLQNSAGTAPADLCAGVTGCADAGCNCTYGYGYLDAYAAALSCLTGTESGTLEGHVYDRNTAAPIDAAEIAVASAFSSDKNVAAITDPSGYYTLALAPGTYDLTAAKQGYVSQRATGLVVVSQLVTHQDFDLPFIRGTIYLPLVFKGR